MNIFKKGKLTETEISRWLLELRKNTYAPETDFGVTGVFRARFQGVEDYYFGGVNVENIDHRIGTHSEEACIAAMITGLGRQAAIVEAWVMGAPRKMKPEDHDPAVDRVVTCCGKCRQQISSFADVDVKIHSVSLRGKISTTTVGAFLPGLYTLREFTEARAVTTGTKAVTVHEEKIKNRLTRKGPLSDQEIYAWLKDIESVDYIGKVSQSIVLKLDNGAYAAGTQVEETASVSMNAAQSAVAIAISEFGMRPIQEIWVYTKGRDGKDIPHDSFGTLTMSALQTLLPVAAHNQIPLHFMSGDNSVIDMTLVDAAKIAPTSNHPFCKKP